MLCMAQAAAIGKQANFAAIGLAIDAISQHPDWERWEGNRGEIFAKIFPDNRVVLTYSPRVKPGTRIPDKDGVPEYEGLARAMEEVHRKRREKMSAEEKRKENGRQIVEALTPTVYTILVFDLRTILEEADQRLAKLFG
jgi:hypothetical protein